MQMVYINLYSDRTTKDLLRAVVLKSGWVQWWPRTLKLAHCRMLEVR